MNTLTKIVDDTLKTEGKWSRKALTMFTSFGCGIVSGFYIIFKYENYALEVYVVFMLMATGQSIIAYKEKKNRHENQHEADINEQNIEAAR